MTPEETPELLRGLAKLIHPTCGDLAAASLCFAADHIESLQSQLEDCQRRMNLSSPGEKPYPPKCADYYGCEFDGTDRCIHCGEEF